MADSKLLAACLPTGKWNFAPDYKALNSIKRGRRDSIPNLYLGHKTTNSTPNSLPSLIQINTNHTPSFTLMKTGPLKSWQAIFIAYGSISVLWGTFVLIWMPDSPMRAKCFSESDKRLMLERVRTNLTGVQNRHFRKEQMIEALLDPQTSCYCIVSILSLTFLITFQRLWIWIVGKQ